MANSVHVIKATLGGLKSVVGGARYHDADYIDLLGLLYRLIRLVTSKGTMAVESHIENPQESTIFKEHPKILLNKEVVNLVCDYFRMIGMDADDPHQVEDVMGRELKKTLVEKMHPVHALQGMTDGLPALGIIAAVLGVIKTMSHINEPPAVLGEMIGGALVGTFLGVLLAYGMVGPVAARLKQVVEEEARYLEVIQGKTAALFAAACQIGAVVSNRPDSEEIALADYGMNLGIAFQLVDDALDYVADQAVLGKTIGDDFREGKITLPVLVAFSAGDETEQTFWRRTVETLEQTDSDLDHAMRLIARHGAIRVTLDRAQRFVQEAKVALLAFPDSPIRRALADVADYTVLRLR